MLSPGWVQSSPEFTPCIHPGCNKKTFSEYGACKKHSGKHHSRAFYQRQKLAKIQASDEEYSEEYSEEELGLDLFGGGIVRG